MKPKIIQLRGEYRIDAPREQIYEVLTDFERLPEYFPNVAKEAKYKSRDGNHFVVEAQTKAFLGSKTFKVLMKGEFNPPEGFVSTNTSSLGTEHEVVSMEEVPGGTVFHYVNDVEIKSSVYRILGNILIKRLALWYWERAVIGKMREMLE